ncbi:MAG: YfhO family protein, partial [Oscillospiraceae bacterium]|nr:YfhO family protein [Oscillospiraceae bacterium]
MKIKLPEKKFILLCAASALIPMGLMLVSFAFLKMAPFGSDTMLFIDANGQYLDFLSYFKTVLTGENDFFYSFSKGLGGDFLSLAAYYLLSPFNILFVFSSYGSSPIVFTLVYLLKIACCGLSFFFASCKIYGSRSVLLSFSTAYALMAYNVVFGCNIMWLDAVVILPLLGLGIYKIWTEKKFLLYTLSLMYALLTNYYTGYMLCIASVMFSTAIMINSQDDIKDKAKNFGKYIFASCIAGFSTSFIWLPAILSIGGERAGSNLTALSMKLYFNFTELFSKLVAGSANHMQLLGGLPQIFCSTAVLFLLLLFFLNKSISIKKKLTAGLCILILVISFNVSILNTIWHGFAGNNGFNYRYSFILSYIFVFIAQFQFIKGGRIGKKESFASAAVLLLMLIFVWIKGYEYVPQKGLIISLICLASVFSAMFFVEKTERIRLGAAILLAAVILETGANCYLSMSRLIYESTHTRVYDIYNFTDST